MHVKRSGLVQMNVMARSPCEHDLVTAHRTRAAISLYVSRTGKERGIPKYFKTPFTTKAMLNTQTCTSLSTIIAVQTILLTQNKYNIFF
jgi:hypothetical protein